MSWVKYFDLAFYASLLQTRTVCSNVINVRPFLLCLLTGWAAKKNSLIKSWNLSLPHSLILNISHFSPDFLSTKGTICSFRWVNQTSINRIFFERNCMSGKPHWSSNKNYPTIKKCPFSSTFQTKPPLKAHVKRAQLTDVQCQIGTNVSLEKVRLAPRGLTISKD